MSLFPLPLTQLGQCQSMLARPPGHLFVLPVSHAHDHAHIHSSCTLSGPSLYSYNWPSSQKRPSICSPEKYSAVVRQELDINKNTRIRKGNQNHNDDCNQV